MATSKKVALRALSHLSGVPLKFIPKEDIFDESESLQNYSYLFSTSEGISSDDVERRHELKHMIGSLVAKPRENEDQLAHPDHEVEETTKRLLSKLSNASNERAVHSAVLGLLLLTHTHPEAVKTFDFRNKIQTDIIDKYPTANYLQGAANNLLNLEEDLTHLTIPKDARKPFELPPFQKSLPYFPKFGYQVTLRFKNNQLDRNIMKSLVSLIEKLKVKCKEIDGRYQPSSDGSVEAHSGFNLGFDLDYWVEWCRLRGRNPSVPVQEATKMMSNDETNFMKRHRKLQYTKGQVWFYLKTDEKEECEELLSLVQTHVKEQGLPAELLITTAYKKSEGRLFGGQFLDGIVNAIDAISMLREILLSPMPVFNNDVNPDGGTFAFVQFFEFDKPALTSNSQPISENMIGRDSIFSETLARLDERCHVKRARVIDRKDGTNTELIRQALPYVVQSSDTDYGPDTNGLFFVAFGKSAERFATILKNILGEPDGFTTDLLMNNVQGKFGRFFYCPNTAEVEALPKFIDADLYPEIPFWSNFSSENPALFYNHIQYLRAMSMNEYIHKDPPSKRILYLMSKVFSRWHSTWTHKFDVPRLPHLKKFLHEDEKFVMDLSIQERKGYSYKKMLGEVLTSNTPLPGPHGKVYGYSECFDTYRIDPKELIVGVTDRLSFGSGKEVMPYLQEGTETSLSTEKARSYELLLSEAGNMGHIVPGHKYILEQGVSGMLKNLREKLKQKDLKEDQRRFYQGAIYGFEGVQAYLLQYAKLARETGEKLNDRTSEVIDRRNLRTVADRMLRLAYGHPRNFTFHDALQMVFSMHCCFHLVGQPVSVGRLDQILLPFYKRDIANGKLKGSEAQELIDAFFIKFDEHVVLNRYNIPYGHRTFGTTCITGKGGPFGTGDSLNQWIQQITVGGCDENGQDAFNDITLMCLKAARRLPLNAPCLSLRLTPTTPSIIKEETAKALLSGGAHPILYHDRKMIDGLYDVLLESFERFHLPIPDDLRQVARDYACDGCFEPMFCGRTEFKFQYIPVLNAIVYAINSGADYITAGTDGLAGVVPSIRTPPAEEICSFDKFKTYFRLHLKLMVVGIFKEILQCYGHPWEICPAPMLSCLIEGCVDSGKDMTNGGSRFHILTAMYLGFTNTVNSLYNIKKIVYDENDVASLRVLKMALINNWGETMVEPFYHSVTDDKRNLHTEMWAQRFKDLRQYAMSLPKFGTDTADKEINELAGWLAQEMDKIAHEALYDEPSNFELYEELRKKHSVPGKPFVFQVMTGAGTFENYVSIGLISGATPDGRLKGQPIASDVSQQPYVQDQPVPLAKPLDIIDSLKPYNEIKLHKYIPNGCEIDINIPENFPKEALLDFIDAFIKEETGSNLVTVTCIDDLTMERARLQPQKFDLVRNRMGGWSNFFVAMFDEHQKQHARRPVFGPHKKS